MRVGGRPYRTIFLANPAGDVAVIDQTRLPFEFELRTLASVADAAEAICAMVVRGAPLIGVTAAYGVALALRDDATDRSLAAALERLAATRPTAVNLRWALERMRLAVAGTGIAGRRERAYAEAAAIAEEDVAACAAIGRHGRALIERIAQRKSGGPVNVLTHCNAGWLACVDWGTALAPVYAAHDAGVAVHVYVDETRPRGQGALLTAFELGAHGVPCTVIADNAGGHLMQHGAVDLCLVGSDRTTATGDVANKIGTYLKALAAHDNGVPFYAALPASTIDWTLADGVRDIPIEDRGPREVTHVRGLAGDGRVVEVQVTAPGSGAANPGFDVTPARLLSGLVTERGIAVASREGLLALYPERDPRQGGATREMGEGLLPVAGASARVPCEDAVEIQPGPAAIVATARALDAAGLVPNKSGNVSCRTAPGRFAITAAGVPYAGMTAAHIVELDLVDGPAATGPRPSSEWRMHAAIYAARPDVGAIVHTHSPRATALACAGLGIPPFHYMIAVAGGAIRCMPYATFGTGELASMAVTGLEARRATLLANHGVVAVGPTLDVARSVALEVENLAGQWLELRAAGLEPKLLGDDELRRVREKFAAYGRLG